MRDFEVSLLVRPDDATLYFNRGLAHARNGAPDRGIADCMDAIRLKPDLAIAFHNRGYEHERAGRRREAIADYTAALAIHPDLTPSRQGLERLDKPL